jgi:hypothetical protein
MTMPRSLPWVAAALTLVGVPAGLAVTGGNLRDVMTATVAVWLAMLMLLVRRRRPRRRPVGRDWRR